jgi:predicted Zn-ribbon and HTH transcriptional regulator
MIIIIIGDTMKKYRCKKCGYEWLPRIESKPKECPDCKSREWYK